MELTKEVIAEIADLGRNAAAVTIGAIKAPAGVQGLPETAPIAVRHGDAPELLDVRPLFEKWRSRPERRAGTATTLTLESFNALLSRHKTAESVVFADTNWRNPSLTAVIDYHPVDPRGGADNGKHRISYKFPLSEPWQAWVGRNGQPMAQADFAAFIEDHIADLCTATEDHRDQLEATFSTRVATPADILQLSRGLQVHVDSAVRNIVNLQTGETQVAFEEQHKDSTGRPLSVPGLFVINVAPFFMGDAMRIPVRLRYRQKDGKLAWFFQLYRPDMHITERVRSDLVEVSSANGCPVFEGAPEQG